MLNNKQIEYIFSSGVDLNEYFAILTELPLLERYCRYPMMYKGKRTAAGLEFINEVASIQEVDNNFEEIWNLYPDTDQYRNFPCTRTGIRGSKIKAIEAYNNCLDKDKIKKGIVNLLERIQLQQIDKNQLTYQKALNRFISEKDYLNITEVNYAEEDLL